MPRLGALVLGLVLLPALLLTGCGRLASPKGWASPIVSNDLLLVSPQHNKLVAISLTTEQEEWRFPGEGSKRQLRALYATPVVADGEVFLGGYDGNLYALDIENGGEVWLFQTQGHIVGGPVVVDGTVYFGSSDHCIYAVEAQTGESAWNRFCTGAKIWSTPAVSDGVVFVTSMDHKAYALDALTGETRWSQPFKTGGAISSSPVVADGVVYFGSLDKKFYAVDASSGEERWSFEADDWIWNRAVVSGGRVYFGTLGGSVYALDADSGELVWQQPFKTLADAGVRAAPALVGSRLVVADEDGNLYGLDAANGEEDWTESRLSGILSDLSVDGNTVYYASEGGAVESVDPSNGSITTLLAAK